MHLVSAWMHPFLNHYGVGMLWSLYLILSAWPPVAAFRGAMAAPVTLFDVAGDVPVIGVRMRHRSSAVGVDRGVLQCFVCTTRRQCLHVELVRSKTEVPPQDPDAPSGLLAIYDALLQHKQIPAPSRRAVSRNAIQLLPKQETKSTEVIGKHVNQSKHVMANVFMQLWHWLMKCSLYSAWCPTQCIASAGPWLFPDIEKCSACGCDFDSNCFQTDGKLYPLFTFSTVHKVTGMQVIYI